MVTKRRRPGSSPVGGESCVSALSDCSVVATRRGSSVSCVPSVVAPVPIACARARKLRQIVSADERNVVADSLPGAANVILAVGWGPEPAEPCAAGAPAELVAPAELDVAPLLVVLTASVELLEEAGDGSAGAVVRPGGTNTACLDRFGELEPPQPAIASSAAASAAIVHERLTRAGII